MTGYSQTNCKGQGGTILLIGSGDRSYREYVCAAIAKEHRLVLLESAAATWQRPYIVDAVEVPLGDREAALSAARRCAVTYDLRGVLTYDETRVRLAAEIAATLGIPHLDRGAAARCRDKLATRQALALAGVPSARARHVRTLREARASAAAIGYPLVLKPRGLAGSIGVTRVDHPRELDGAFAMAGQARLDGVSPLGLLVEEYLEGPELSVDCAVLNGRVEFATVAQKRLGFAPFFEEVGHAVDPSANSRLPLDAIRSVVTEAHRALGVDRGMTHTELRLTPGGPCVVEVNARLGGDLIPYVGYLATGIDLAAAAAAVAVGRRPRLDPTRSQAAAIRFFYPRVDSRVLHVGLEPSWPRPSWLDRLCWEASPGDVLRLPPAGFLSRLGFAIVTGRSERECEARLDEVEQSLRVTCEALDQAPKPRIAGVTA